jgi:hypothetical protein
MSNTRLAMAAAALTFLIAPQASAHGFAGNRFFPGTIAVEDPAVADELALPTLSSQDGETEYEIEWGKRITPTFGISFGGAYVDGQGAQGWSNLVTGLKYQFLTDTESETILAAGLEVEWGGTGDHSVAEDTTTVVPTFYFGHGFGRARAEWARPFAVTGSLGYAMATNHQDETPDVVEAGLTLQYSLPYLSTHVRDHGWPDWVNQLTPLVEVAVERPTSGDEGLTGTVNPGILWTGRHIQLGAEAMIPINDESGDDVGFRLQLHVFVDDLFAHSLGRPLFGAQ